MMKFFLSYVFTELPNGFRCVDWAEHGPTSLVGLALYQLGQPSVTQPLPWSSQHILTS